MTRMQKHLNELSGLPFAPWVQEEARRRALCELVALIEGYVREARERPPTEEELDALDELEGEGGKAEWICRSLRGCTTIEQPAQRVAMLQQGLGRLKRLYAAQLQTGAKQAR